MLPCLSRHPKRRQDAAVSVRSHKDIHIRQWVPTVLCRPVYAVGLVPQKALWGPLEPGLGVGLHQAFDQGSKYVFSVLLCQILE